MMSAPFLYALINSLKFVCCDIDVYPNNLIPFQYYGAMQVLTGNGSNT